MKTIKQIKHGCNEGNWCAEGHLCSRCQEMLEQTNEIIKMIEEWNITYENGTSFFNEKDGNYRTNSGEIFVERLLSKLRGKK